MCRVPTESDTAIKFVFDDTTQGVSCVIRAVLCSALVSYESRNVMSGKTMPTIPVEIF